jgi:hypothetical protein
MYWLTNVSYSLAHLAVPYGGRQDTRLEPKYIQMGQNLAVHYGGRQNARLEPKYIQMGHNAAQPLRPCPGRHTCIDSQASSLVLHHDGQTNKQKLTPEYMMGRTEATARHCIMNRGAGILLCSQTNPGYHCNHIRDCSTAGQAPNKTVSASESYIIIVYNNLNRDFSPCNTSSPQPSLQSTHG